MTQTSAWLWPWQRSALRADQDVEDSAAICRRAGGSGCSLRCRPRPMITVREAARGSSTASEQDERRADRR